MAMLDWHLQISLLRQIRWRGLQLGAMRLPSINFTPTGRDGPPIVLSIIGGVQPTTTTTAAACSAFTETPQLWSSTVENRVCRPIPETKKII